MCIVSKKIWFGPEKKILEFLKYFSFRNKEKKVKSLPIGLFQASAYSKIIFFGIYVKNIFPNNAAIFSIFYNHGNLCQKYYIRVKYNFYVKKKKVISGFQLMMLRNVCAHFILINSGFFEKLYQV